MTKTLLVLLVVSVFGLGVVAGVTIQQALNLKLIGKAEANCHSWCDANNQQEIANALCKAQCTGIIIESQCLKFPAT